MRASPKVAGYRATGAAGMALIEALVALAVMAFGLLGVVGMQATLRFNADVSRQRADAVRLAQEQMETLRSFGVLSGATSPDRDYAGIVDGSDNPTPPSSIANTDFTRTWTVTAPGANDPKLKSVWVEVKWRDRRTAAASADSAQERVFLASTIAGVAPELAATLGLPGDLSATQRPRGRNASIPLGAVDQGNGTSTFAPPGAPTGTTWTFVNATGQITRLCFPAGTCTSVLGWLLSGYISFATGAAPTEAEGESPVDPVDPSLTIGVSVVTTTSPAPTTSPVCFSLGATFNVAYYCFVPVNTSPTVWSGRSELSLVNTISGTTRLSTTLADNAPAYLKVCRYTPEASHILTTGGNQAHPLDYTNVNSSLSNQNFLVISAGNGGSSFSCPGDDTSTPLINSNTFAHQPRT